MTTMFLPFQQRFGGDASQDVHVYEQAPSAPTATHPPDQADHLTSVMAEKDSEIDSLKRELTTLRAERKYAAEVHQRTLNSLLQCKVEASAYQKELVVVKDELSTAKAKLDCVTHTLYKERNATATLRTGYEFIRAEATETRRKLGLARQENGELSQRLQVVAQRLQAAEEKVEKSEYAVTVLKEDLKDTRDERKEAETRAELLSRDKSALAWRVHELEKALDAETERANTAEQQYIQAGLSSWQAQARQMSAALAKQRARADAAECQCIFLTRKCEETTRACHERVDALKLDLERAQVDYNRKLERKNAEIMQYKRCLGAHGLEW
jgi:chromosome segregation ATPase